MEKELSKDIPFTVEETKMLREKFIEKYCKEKGWNSKNLSSNQMLEVVTHRNYKNPGLILG
tara:strand:- start:4929 stop:5111 length:183 start_codon:yes stop_codon:yes gene_type:complete